jgi:hypothetical protein
MTQTLLSATEQTDGTTHLDALLAGSLHWLQWRLERLLAPLTALNPGGEIPLEVLQQVEREGQALIKPLSDGVLRRTAEQRLEQALQARSPEQPNPKPRAVSVLLEPAACSPRQRAERRVLRLYVHAPECRELLQCLSLADPACRVAFDWLNNLAVLAVDGAIAGMALQLSAQLPGAVGVVLAQAAAPGPEVIAVLRREPQAELQALLDALEPVALAGAGT